MRVIVQRCAHAQVTIDGQTVGHIERGFLLLVGFNETDTKADVEIVAKKVAQLRVFEDAEGKMNLSLHDVHGQILSISQFTLYADCRKGNRPSFVRAARPETAEPLYDYFNQILREQYLLSVETGRFGADMKVDLLNDGPVTIILDSDELAPKRLSLETVIEQLARNVHDTWMAGRIAEGWTWGPERDDANKKHPCLVPYDQLPENEKEYDRQTALETIRTIMNLNYKITPA